MRYSLSYIQDKNINKEVVYFVANAKKDIELKKQEKEISNIFWVDIEDVKNKLTYDNLRETWEKVYNDIKKSLI